MIEPHGKTSFPAAGIKMRHYETATKRNAAFGKKRTSDNRSDWRGQSYIHVPFSSVDGITSQDWRR